VGVQGAAPRGGENGAERGGRGSATWTGTTQTWRLWVAPIATGLRREQGRAVACAARNGAADR
jgi:hypothetical protein